MDPETANRLNELGGTLLCLDVPQGTVFGIDYNMWTVGPNFKGVKMIPPGVHFIHQSAGDKYGELAPRTGFFLWFVERQVAVRKWNPVVEDFFPPDHFTDVDVERYALGVANHDFDRFLGAYPYDDTRRKWQRLTNYITHELVKRLQPESGKVVTSTLPLSSAEEAVLATGEEPVGAARERTAPKEPRALAEGAALVPVRFTPIDLRWLPPGAAPADVTRFSMDRTYLLERHLEHDYGADASQLLGELQFAFACFLVGQSFEGFEQWKILVRLLCSCTEALVNRPGMFVSFLEVLSAQIEEMQPDLFADGTSGSNVLAQSLASLFENASDDSLDTALRRHCRLLEKAVADRFGFSFPSASKGPEQFGGESDLDSYLASLGDDAPMVVVDDADRDAVRAARAAQEPFAERVDAAPLWYHQAGADPTRTVADAREAP